MNYSRYQMTQLLYTDFIKSFEEQYPNTPWATVQTKINKAIYNSVLAAIPKIKKYAIRSTIIFTVHDLIFLYRSQSKFDVSQCSGMYGVDVMVDSEMNAKVLEINFGPDCTRACNYDPHFYNVLFAVMFTNDWYQNPEITQRVVPI
jgi:tubulin--tyrosine ligase-like protein 12